MRILLLNPPVPRRAFTNRDLMGGMGIDDGFGTGLGPRLIATMKYEGIRLPVLALAYAAAQLKQRGHEVTALDLSRETPEAPAALEAVVNARPEWIVAATSYAWLGSELKFLQAAKERTGAKRLLTGYAATHFAREIVARKLAEVISTGDPEVACGHLAAGTLAPGKPGVLMAGTLGDLVPAQEAYVEDLDTLPFPDWEPFDRSELSYFPLLKRRPFLTMLSSRGCPYACGFCPYPVGQGKPWRARTAKAVVDEMQHLVERWGARSILFRDPTFSLDLARTKEICRELLARKVDVEWGIETRLDRMDDEMIDLLGAAGCRSAEMGIDPLDAETLKASNRRTLAQQKVANLITRMEKNRISTAGLFVIGLPEQDDDEMNRTLEWIATLDLSYINYELATPFPGTPLYRDAVAKGWASELTLGDLLEGDPKLGFNGVIDLPRMRAIQDEALRRFYVRPRKVVRELFSGNMISNLTFMASCGLKVLRPRPAA